MELSSWIPEKLRNSQIFHFFLIISGGALLIIMNISDFAKYKPVRRIIADSIKLSTPLNAVVISSIDPVYLQFMTSEHKQKRLVIPVSRNIEYASKLIAPGPLQKIHPASCFDHRNPDLIPAGAEEAVPITAVENINAIIVLAKSGRRIFIDISRISRKDSEQFRRLYSESFIFKKVNRFLYELVPR